jgi:hypothetical protein
VNAAMPMRSERSIVRCDWCSFATPAIDPRSPSEVDDVLRTAGWMRTSGVTLCPRCRAKSLPARPPRAGSR